LCCFWVVGVGVGVRVVFCIFFAFLSIFKRFFVIAGF
jgi:hypothetical protein